VEDIEGRRRIRKRSNGNLKFKEREKGRLQAWGKEGNT
jgi:hypothetical protein